MYITKEELNERLEKTDVLYKKRERKERQSEKSGSSEDRLTHNERTLIGVLEELDTQKNIAELKQLLVKLLWVLLLFLPE